MRSPRRWPERNRRRFRGCCRPHRAPPELRAPTGSRVPATAIRTLMATPKSRCGATVSSISVDSGMRSNGAPVEDSCVILARISRQRCACSRRVLRSPASGLLSCTVFSSSREIRKIVDSGVPSSCAAAAARSIELGEMLFAGQHQFGGGQRVREFAGLFGDLERIETGDADRDHDREPDAEQIDRRQHQRFVACPRAAADGRKPARRRRPPRESRARSSAASAARWRRSEPGPGTGMKTGFAGRR